MGTGTILIGFALLTVIVVLIVSPLLERHRPAIEPQGPRQTLEAEREETIRAIRDLDLDYRTNKLNEDDYKELRVQMVNRGASILRELDQIDEDSEIDTQIEERVKQIRNTPPAVCPSCGTAIHENDRFCANCGHKFELIVKAASDEGQHR